jgi:hypothetical protein
MENNNLTPVLQLRQDDVVAIPLARYEHLIECETRLSILIQIRRHEIANEGSSYVRADDQILGSEVMSAHWLKRAGSDSEEAKKDE